MSDILKLFSLQNRENLSIILIRLIIKRETPVYYGLPYDGLIIPGPIREGCFNGIDSFK
jgi:hypothetical protein